MKFIREIQKNEIIIINKKDETVRIRETSILNIGNSISLYGNSSTEFREYMQMEFTGNEYFNIWPIVERIEYIEESDCLLFRDFIEIYDEYLETDKPFITDIYFYVDFRGNILTDAYSPLLDKYYPLDIDNEIARCPWLNDNLSVKEKFYRRYKEVKEDIGWQMIFLIDNRKKDMEKKLLNRKKANYENTKC